VNGWARGRAVDKLSSALGDLESRKIGVLGLAFKPGTDDVRDSPAVSIVQSLIDRGAVVAVYDPVAVVRDLDAVIAVDAYDAACDADAVVIATAWPEFALLDGDRLANLMAGHLVLDLVGSLSPYELEPTGLELVALGRGTPDSFHPVVVPPLEWCLGVGLA
jgi:UDPglucose 6-dehydrogenase